MQKKIERKDVMIIEEKKNRWREFLSTRIKINEISQSYILLLHKDLHLARLLNK